MEMTLHIRQKEYLFALALTSTLWFLGDLRDNRMRRDLTARDVH